MTAIVPLLPLNWRGRLKTSFMCILFLLVCLCCCIFFLVVHSIYFIHSWHDIACFNQPSVHLMPRRWQCSRGLINYLLTSRSHWRHNVMGRIAWKSVIQGKSQHCGVIIFIIIFDWACCHRCSSLLSLTPWYWLLWLRNLLCSIHWGCRPVTSTPVLRPNHSAGPMHSPRKRGSVSSVLS